MVVRDRCDVTDNASGKRVVRERRDVTDNVRGERGRSGVT